MTSPSKPNGCWEACPSGKLQRVAAHLAAREHLCDRNRIVGRAVTVVLLFVLVGGIAYWSTLPQSLGGLTCAECQSHFAEYHKLLASERENLPEGLFHQVEYHLDHCTACRAQFSESYPETLASIGPASCLADPAASQAQAAVLQVAVISLGN